MKARVFEHGSDNLEDIINKWLKESENITIVAQLTACMHDLYEDSRVCNQWFQTTVYFKEEIT